MGIIYNKYKKGHLSPFINYFLGGLLPRPPPDGFPVLLGPFGGVLDIIYSF